MTGATRHSPQGTYHLTDCRRHCNISGLPQRTACCSALALVPVSSQLAHSCAWVKCHGDNRKEMSSERGGNMTWKLWEL
eukprot:14034621-Alexandrium_andersonii.AAC.2